MADTSAAARSRIFLALSLNTELLNHEETAQSIDPAPPVP